MIYVCADPHFGHKNIIKYCKRPWADVEAMDRDLMNNINSRVQFNDILWIIGDFTFKGPVPLRNLRARIHCQTVHLILGNHDSRPVPDGVFSSVSWYQEFSDNGVRFTLCHYPFRTWNKAHHNSKDKITSVDLYEIGRAHV